MVGQTPRREPTDASGGRSQLAGAAAITRALCDGASLRLVLLRRGAGGEQVRELVEKARAAGIPVRRVADRELERLRSTPEACDTLGLLGDPPDATREQVLAGSGAVWLLSGVAYPGNAGFAIRTAEVSGAAGVFVDATFGGAGRRAALRASIHAERFLPVFWDKTDSVLADAARCGRRIVGLEDLGDRPPWRVDLRGRVLFLVGGEAAGLSPDTLGRCDAVVRVPMAGFIPSYNLQAAVSAIAAERLRQLEEGAA